MVAKGKVRLNTQGYSKTYMAQILREEPRQFQSSAERPPIEMGIERIEIEIEKLGPFRRPAQEARTGGQEARQEVPKVPSCLEC